MSELIPMNSGSGEIADIKFSWKHPTKAKEYEFWLASDPDFNQIVRKLKVTVDNTGAPSLTLLSKVEGIQSSITYYWKVRVTRAEDNEVGSGQWSQTMSFSTQTQQPPRPSIPPAAPVPLTPTNGASNIEPSPLFSWTSSPDSTGYEFTLSRDSALTQVIIRVNVSSPTYKYEAKLNPDTLYYWQVKTISPVVVPPSPVFSFTVADKGKSLPNSDAVFPTPIVIWITVGLVILTLVVLFSLSLKSHTSKDGRKKG
jgi:hypothetical protein